MQVIKRCNTCVFMEMPVICEQCNDDYNRWAGKKISKGRSPQNTKEGGQMNMTFLDTGFKDINGTVIAGGDWVVFTKPEHDVIEALADPRKFYQLIFGQVQWDERRRDFRLDCCESTLSTVIHNADVVRIHDPSKYKCWGHVDREIKNT